MRRYSTPSALAPAIYFGLAVFLYAASRAGFGWGDWILDGLRLLAGAALVWGLALAVNWQRSEDARRMWERGLAKAAPATAMARALDGKDPKQSEYIANTVYLEFEGNGDPIVIWYWIIPPNRFKVPVDLLVEWLELSKERGDGRLHPIRGHTDSRFRRFANVEESLQRMTAEFVRRRFAYKPIGNQPAQMRVSFEHVEKALNLNIWRHYGEVISDVDEEGEAVGVGPRWVEDH